MRMEVHRAQELAGQLFLLAHTHGKHYADCLGNRVCFRSQVRYLCWYLLLVRACANAKHIATRKNDHAAMTTHDKTNKDTGSFIRHQQAERLDLRAETWAVKVK